MNKISANSIYEFNVVDIHGNNINLEKYKSKVLLIVNTARKDKWARQVK